MAAVLWPRGRVARLRVRLAGGWTTGRCAFAEPIRPLIEEQADGRLKYAFSKLPEETARLRAVRSGEAANLWNSATGG